MIRKLFSQSGVAKGSLIIIVLTLLGSILGLFRDRALAHFLGAGVLSDAYYVSFTIPDIILNIFVMGALGGVFIPIFIDSLHTSEKDASILASTFLFIITIVVVAVSTLCFFFVEDVLRFFTQDNTWSPEELSTAIVLFRIMLLYPMLVGISNTIGCILNAYQHFFSYAVSTALYNVGITLGLMVLYPYMGVYAAGVGVVFGFFLHLLVRMWELRFTSFRFTTQLDFSHSGLRRIFTLMPQRLVTLLAFYGVLFGFTILSLQMEEGTNTIRTYAWNFQSMPINLFAVSIATAALPMLSRLSTEKDGEAYTKVYTQSLSQIVFFALPSAVAIMIIAPAVVELILGTGKFDTESITKTSLALSVFALSIPFESINHLYTRMFYSKKQVFIPALASVLFSLVALLFSYVYGSTYGYVVFPVAWVLASVVQLGFAIVVYHFQDRNLVSMGKTMAMELLKTLLATVVMAIVLIGLRQLHLSVLLSVICSVILGGIGYIVTHLLLKSETVLLARTFFIRKFGNTKKAPSK